MPHADFNQNLSDNFRLSEFTASRTANRLGIDNAPGEREVDNLKRLCRLFLQPVREFYGEPVVITSGYRCPKLNEAVGGVPDSLHQTGEAADFYVAGGPNAKAVFYDLKSEDLVFEELILYPDEHRLHVAVTGQNDRETFIEKGGEYVPA
jgi:hypothetical protein